MSFPIRSVAVAAQGGCRHRPIGSGVVLPSIEGGEPMGVRRRVRRVALAVIACVAILAPMLGAEAAGAAAASPTVTPASGGRGVPVVPGFTQFDLATVGYQQSEVFLSGTAHAYAPTSPLGTDGKFGVAESAAAPYT